MRYQVPLYAMRLNTRTGSLHLFFAHGVNGYKTAMTSIAEILNFTFFSFSFVLPFNQVGEIIYAAIIAPLCLIGVIGNITTITTVLTSSNLK